MGASKCEDRWARLQHSYHTSRSGVRMLHFPVSPENSQAPDFVSISTAATYLHIYILLLLLAVVSTTVYTAATNTAAK